MCKILQGTDKIAEGIIKHHFSDGNKRGELKDKKLDD